MNNKPLYLAALLALAACAGKDGAQPAQPAGQQPAAQSAGAAKGAPEAAGYVKKSTYFRLPLAAGGEVDLASYAGKPVLVTFFTENCPYCRKAAPFLQKVHAAYSPKGLSSVGICVEDSVQAAGNYAGDFGLTFPVAYKGGQVSRAYRTRGVPYIFLLTKDHEIYDVWEGYDPQYDASILKAVETVLKS